jgi:magnesium-transporting ATPase (P-type)
MYIKGSPEVMKKLCNSSTYPKDYDQTFKKYTQKGLRVIALGYKYIPDFDMSKIDEIERESIETDDSFTFCGFLIFINRLKPATKQAIQELREGKFHQKLLKFTLNFIGHIEVYMATGDNALTGMCVSQKCGILNSDEYFIGDLYDNGGHKQLVWENEFRENIIGKKKDDVQSNADGEQVVGQEDDISLDATESRIPSSKGDSK